MHKELHGMYIYISLICTMSRWCILKSKEAIPFITLSVLTNGKPGEVCEIIALYRLKSPSFDSKVKIKLPCLFLQVTLFLHIIIVLR